MMIQVTLFVSIVAFLWVVCLLAIAKQSDNRASIILTKERKKRTKNK
jgi:hypothetical protein